MPDALTVHVNRGELYGLSVPDSFETSESFDVVLVNHGESTHVHLHLDDALSEQTAIEAPNHHVEGDSERTVQVRRTGDGTTRGNLKVVTAYGATTRYVDVTVTEPDEEDESVEVGEELMKPKPKQSPRSEGGLSTVPDRLFLVVSALALVVSVATASVLQSTAILVGVVVVALGALGTVAWVLAVRED